jgi:26S proteasome regulatory subunit N8
MYTMFRKVNSKERIVGWYSSGPKIRKNDIEIHEKFREYNSNPVFCIIKVHEAETLGIPTEAYLSHEELDEEGHLEKNFSHVPSSIDATEAEQVGVEHLLRDIKDVSIGDLSMQISNKVMGLKALGVKIKEIKAYLDDVLEGKYPVNNEIVEIMQDIFNLMPNLNFESIIQSFSVKTNDFMHMTYVCSLIRAIIGVHNLIDRQFEVREKKIKDDKDEKAKIEKIKEDKKKEQEEKEKKAKDASKDADMKDA